MKIFPLILICIGLAVVGNAQGLGLHLQFGGMTNQKFQGHDVITFDVSSRINYEHFFKNNYHLQFGLGYHVSSFLSRTYINQNNNSDYYRTVELSVIGVKKLHKNFLITGGVVNEFPVRNYNIVRDESNGREYQVFGIPEYRKHLTELNIGIMTEFGFKKLRFRAGTYLNQAVLGPDYYREIGLNVGTLYLL